MKRITSSEQSEKMMHHIDWGHGNLSTYIVAAAISLLIKQLVTVLKAEFPAKLWKQVDKAL